MLRKPRDPVDIHLDGMRAEGGQRLRRHKVGMPDMMQLGMPGIEKSRNMPAGNKMHLSDPRRELLHGTEPIRHQPPVAEAVLAVAVVKSHALIFRLFRPPFRVVSVHPENNKIYVHTHLLRDLFSH